MTAQPIKDLVPSRCWYYLLDFNDKDNWETISREFNTKKLSELTLPQFYSLFEMANIRDQITISELTPLPTPPTP